MFSEWHNGGVSSIRHGVKYRWALRGGVVDVGAWRGGGTRGRRKLERVTKASSKTHYLYKLQGVKLQVTFQTLGVISRHTLGIPR